MKLKDLEYIIEDNCRVCLCDRYGHRTPGMYYWKYWRTKALKTLDVKVLGIHTDGCLILTLDVDAK